MTSNFVFEIVEMVYLFISAKQLICIFMINMSFVQSYTLKKKSNRTTIPDDIPLDAIKITISSKCQILPFRTSNTLDKSMLIHEFLLVRGY